MIALGWAFPDDRPPEPLRTYPGPEAALIACADRHGVTGRDRLAQQILAARGLRAFLPLAARRRADLQETMAQALCRSQDLAGRLSLVAGRVQITVRAHWPPPVDPVGGSGRDWLLARAARRQHVSGAEEELRAVLAGRGSVVVSPRSGGVQADALVSSDGVESALQEVASCLAVRPLGAGARLSVTGPWPAFAFCDGLEGAG